MTDRSSLVRGKWIERRVIRQEVERLMSSLVRGKWIERPKSSYGMAVAAVFPREREVD